MHPDYSSKVAFEMRRGLIKSFLFLTIFILASGFFVPALSQSEDGFKVEINGIELPTDETTVVRDLAPFIPLDESLTSALDAAVWVTPCNGRECLMINALETDVEFVIGETTVTSEGRTFDAGVAPFRDRGVIYIPAVAFFDAIGLEYYWDEKDNLLSAEREIEKDQVFDRLSGLIELTAKEKTEKSRIEPHAATDTQVVEDFLETPFMAYTYENTIKVNTVSVSGDKSQSRTEEKGDFYNNFNIRYVGLLKNGYNFQGILRTSETTDTENKKGEVKKFQLSFDKNEKIYLDAYDIQPNFSRYLFRNYSLQGIQYKRIGNHFTLSGAAGKSLKRLRTSKYSRYVGGFRIEREYDSPTDYKVGASVVRVRDTGNIIDTKKQENMTFAVDGEAKLKNNWSMKTESANSYNKYFTLQSTRGTANRTELNYSSRKVNWKNSYERTSSDFYSETAFFTRGKTEFSSLYNKKLNSKALGGVGVKIKRLGNKRTYIYPASLKVKPFDERDTFNLTLKSNFEKTIREDSRIQSSREIQVSDQIGSSRIDARYEERKKKTSTDHAYRHKHTLIIRSTISEKMGTELNMMRERWYHDRQSITRQLNFKVDYEAGPWADLILGFGRYYNTPKSARTTAKIGFQKVDIINDWEIKALYNFQNYREYNVSSFEMSYSFYK